MRHAIHLGPADIRRLAQEASVHPDVITKAYVGAPLRGAAADRARRALERDGHLLPRQRSVIPYPQRRGN